MSDNKYLESDITYLYNL